MRPRPWFTFFVLALMTTPAGVLAGGRSFADEAKSRMKLGFDLEEVSTVTVFADRAVVTRVLGEPLEPGLATLSFEGLPFVLAAGSLNAGILDGSARIVGVELVSAAADIEEGARTEALRTSARTITAELGQVRDRLEALLAQREYLRSTLLSAPVSGQSRVQPSRSLDCWTNTAQGTLVSERPRVP